MYINCKFCGKPDKNYAGFCQRCYYYFVQKKYDIFKDEVEFGKLSFVKDENSSQYGMPICHICGRAYIKLQSHIRHTHSMSKHEYCDKFGLDRGIRMTTDTYNKKMSDLAYKYKMDEQLKEAGKNTRFKKGESNNYERSYMTMERLKQQSFIKNKL